MQITPLAARINRLHAGNTFGSKGSAGDMQVHHWQQGSTGYMQVTPLTATSGCVLRGAFKAGEQGPPDWPETTQTVFIIMQGAVTC